MTANNDKNRFDDLLIFGYACKLFRDDEKALYIDRGKHLIPWMGDDNLKIDRYDVRATLTDITQHEPPPGGYDNRMDYLSAAEQRAEQLCEEERYISLYNNDIEVELYQEEELKRLKTQGYGQIGFNYDQERTSTDSPEEFKKDDEDSKDEPPDEIYVPNSKFFIPQGMQLPETTKIHAIIEKTAKFISTQGPQMEILIKAKQANNSLFEFLNQSSHLNPFYKHTLQALKDGNYPSEGGQAKNTDSENNVEQSGSIYQSYYNPSANQPKIHVPVVKYKPSADCAYTQLINKIKGVPILTEIIPDNRSETSSPNPQSPKPNTNNEVEVKKISSGLMLAQYYNSDSEDESENERNSNGTFNPKNNQQHSNGNTMTSKSNDSQLKTVPENDEPVPAGILCPPSELRTIIDKTAAYVLKNGKDFEDILRSKNDERFTFLQYTNQYHKYYTYKVTGIVCPEPIKASLPLEYAKCSGSGFGPPQKNYEMNKQLAPVSFIIKPKEEPTPNVNLKPALPLEHSSDDDEKPVNETNEKAKPHQYPLAEDLPLPPDFHQQNNLFLQTSTACKPIISPTKINCSLNASTGEVDQTDSFIRDTMLEQQNLQEKKEAKRAEDKVKDRLAQIAREKLGILSKEKQLQLERKRRAMAFLHQIGGPSDTNENIKSIDNAEKSGKNSDTDDSVTFVSITPAVPHRSPTVRRRRNIRTKRLSKDNDSDSDIEVVSRHSRSRSRSTSSRRSRYKNKSKTKTKSKSKSKSKHSKKKSHKRRSRSRSSREHKRKKHRYSDDRYSDN